MTRTEDAAANSQEGGAPAVVRMRLQGANPKPAAHGVDLMPGRSNYFLGKDPAKWRSNVAQYAKVRMTDVYPGIDVIYYGNQRQLEYDFVVKPGADPSRIRFQYEGAERITVSADGDLVLGLHGGELRQRVPVVYQERHGTRLAVHASYRSLGDGAFGIVLGNYDRSRPLIIDPVLAYSTFLGGSGIDSVQALAVDAAGNTYISGPTRSTNFPVTAGAFQSANAGGQDVFIAKLNAAGSALLYSTYLGGTQDDQPLDITVDGAGNVYVTGYTFSTDFATTAGSLQPVYGGGGADAFITKLNATGSALVYSTYLGGSGNEQGDAIAIDSLGNAYMGGAATAGFPVTAGAFQTTNGGGFDALVAKLNPTGTALVYATYLGSIGTDLVNGIAVDAAGFAYAAGGTDSPGFSSFPTTAGAFRTVNLGNSQDAFITKLSQNGSSLVYSTLLGGTDADGANGIAIDGTGNAYVTGFARSLDFPTTTGVVQPANGSPSVNYDAFVTKVNSTGTALLYSTYLGGTDSEFGTRIAIDAAGDAFAVGFTGSTNFPTANPLQATNAGGSDAFIAELNPTATQFVFSTYLGGLNDDFAHAVAVDSSGNVHVGGNTGSATFPTTPGSFQPVYGGPAPTLSQSSPEGFVVLLSSNADLGITKSDGVTTVASGGSVTYTITASNAGPAGVTGATVTDPFPATLTCNWTCTGAGGGICTASGSGNINDSVNLPNGGSVTYAAVCSVSALAIGTVSNTATITAPSGVSDPTPGNNSATDSDVIVSTVDLALTKAASVPLVEQGGALSYTLHLVNNGPAAATSVTVTDTLPAGMTATSIVTTAGSCSGTTVITCNIPTLASGAAANITIAVNTTNATVGSTTNTATATSAQTDSAPANNVATAGVTVIKLGSIPTVTPIGLLLLLCVLGAGGVIAIKRS